MIRPVVRNVVSSVVRNVIAGDDQVSRFFTRFDSGVNSYGEFTSDIVLDGDFEIELDYAGNGSDFRELVGSVSSDRLLRIDSGGVARAYAGLVSVIGTTDVADGKVHKIGSSRVGTTLSLYVDNALDGQLTNASVAGSMTINTIMRHLSLYIDGRPSNLKIWKDGDRDTGTLVVNSPMDDAPTATYFRNEAAVLGPEEVTNGNFEDGINDWVAVNAALSVVDGELKVVGTSNTDRATQIVEGLSVGVTCLVSGNIKNGTASPEMIVWNAAQTVVLGRSSIDGGGFIITPTETSVVIWLRANAGEAFFDNISIKEIPASTPLIIKRNIADTQTSSFDQVADGWTGPELWTFGPVTSNGSEGLFVNLALHSILTVGQVSKWGFDAEGFTEGQMRYRLGNADVASVAVDGNYSGISAPVDTDLARVRTGVAQPNAGATFANISTKEFLEVAS